MLPCTKRAILLSATFSSTLLCLSQTTPSADSIAKAMETVVVTGQYLPQSLKNSVYKVRVISEERIRLRGATDITGVLNNEAGIRFSNDFALGESDISLMGVNGQNVKILVDGVPLVDRGGFKQSLSQVDINTVERIEIVEGPMSVVYGTDALAGVINIITKKPKGGANNLSVSARVQEESAGSHYHPFLYDGTHHEHIGINWSQNQWNGGAYLTRNNFGGYSDTAAYPTQLWKPKDQWLTGVTLGYRRDRINTRYRLDYLNEEIFAAGKVNTNNYQALDQYFLTHRYTHQLQNDWQIATGLKLNTALSYQDYTRNSSTYQINYRDDTKAATDPALPGNEGQWDVSTFKNFFFRSTLQWMASDKLSLQPGVEVKTDHTSGQRVNGAPTITDYSFFASAEYKPATRINIRPGVRFSHNSVYKAPPVIPSVNTKIALSKAFDLRLSYGRGFRAPVLRELYFVFKDANHDIQGNTSLKAEYSNSYQASLAWQPATAKELAYTSVLSGFYNDFRNRIELATVPNSTVYTYINIAKFKTTGATLENTVAYQSLSATVAAAYIGRYNSFSDDPAYKNNDLPEFVWSPEVSANLIYHLTKLKAQLGLFYKYTGRLPSYESGTNTATGQPEVYLGKIDSYHWADVTLSKNVLRYFTLQAGVKNLFDVTRVQNSVQGTGSAHSSSGPLLAGYGRSYFLGLAFQWSRH